MHVAGCTWGGVIVSIVPACLAMPDLSASFVAGEVLEHTKQVLVANKYSTVLRYLGVG
jgi:hypothetical protein